MNEDQKIPAIDDDNGEEASFEVDAKDFSKYWNYLKKKENIALGILGGVAAALIALIIWAVLIKFSGYKVGWMAIVAGAGIGFAVRYLGKGISPEFGIAGGAIAFLLWLFGNLITAVLIFSRMKNISFLTIISHMDFPTVMVFLKAVISPIDWLLGFAAAYTAYFFGFKKVSPPQ
jgi:hypothetical protein